MKSNNQNLHKHSFIITEGPASLPGTVASRISWATQETETAAHPKLHYHLENIVFKSFKVQHVERLLKKVLKNNA